MKTYWTAACAALAAVCVLGTGVAALSAPPAPLAGPPDDGNGKMSAFSGGGGDSVLGATLYEQRCAGCHEHATGRIPTRAAISDNTPVFLANTMFGGIMQPMAAGLSPHEIVSIAAYVSTRKGGGVGGLGPDTPRCPGPPPPMDLTAPRQWNGWGATERQARYQPSPGLSVADVPRLKLKWAFAYSNTRNGQATVVGDRLFLTSSSGAVYALNARTGCGYWKFDAPGATRSTIIVGDLPGAPGRHAVYFTDYTRNAYALDADTGVVIWRTQVDTQKEVQMTGSPALHDGKLFVPVSSAEEAIARDPNYECCKFRGALAAVDAVTGRLLWKTYMTPEPAKPFTNPKGRRMFGPAGGAIWSAPTIDAKRHLVYVATGDPYTDIDFRNADAILALDEQTGAIRWSRQMTRGDTYITDCYGAKVVPNCPTHPGADYDFGASPILHTLPSGREVILAGQKSSQVYALDPDHDGKLIWSKRLSPGGPLGGVEFGPAADGKAMYVAISDIYVPPGAQAVPSLTAMRISDGATLWQYKPPKLACAWTTAYCTPAISQAVSAMPGAVFAGSMDGRFRALDTVTGRTLWEYDTAAAPVNTVGGREAQGGVMDGAGPTIAGGMVYVNSGYQGRSGRPGTVLMAFSVDGK